MNTTMTSVADLPDTTPGAASERELADALRFLAIDAVQQANSGHPGMPMGMADIAAVLWHRYMRHNPANPKWPNRDRFVLSNGHGSMLLYGLLHLTGYDLGINDLKAFRQLHSKTPGHPEVGITPGVETTTGPLGQGLANAVGMALGEALQAKRFNDNGHVPVDHRTWVFAGDGCLMEGISHEACSLAGTLGLGKLVVFYDNNGISIDGEVKGWFTDDTVARFRAYGWQVIENVDGHDHTAITAAIDSACADTRHPTLIDCRTTIGFGSPGKAGSHDSHGAPLGDTEIAATRQALGWRHGPFEIPAHVRSTFDARERGRQLEAEWRERLDTWRASAPDAAREFDRRNGGELPDDWPVRASDAIDALRGNDATIATRKASEAALNAFGPLLPELHGGSADLTGSNNTWWSGCNANNYQHYGVREFGMAAIMNGLALHGGFIPYGGTFLVFSDYSRNAIRMAAINRVGVIHVLTHDSIGLGEDGPTHQPVEHLMALRAIPGCKVWRPADLVETAVAWKQAIEQRNAPSCLALSRQGLPPLTADIDSQTIARGGYVLIDCEGMPELIVMATGSELHVAVEAVQCLARDHARRVRLVSMPCCEIFDSQDDDYRASVLPDAVRTRIAIEAGRSDYWRKYVGIDGDVLGIDRFGESAPGGVLYRHFGLTSAALVERSLALLG